MNWQGLAAAGLSVACSLCVAQTVVDGHTPVVVQTPQRLSDWLLQNGPSTSSTLSVPDAHSYPLGLMWLTPEQKVLQQQQAQAVQAQLQALHASQAISTLAFEGLQQALRALPPTGRVRVAAAQPQWLGANPLRDPMLRAGDGVVQVTRPNTLRVMRSDGAVCDVPHQAGLFAHHYVHACWPVGGAGAEPNGTTRTAPDLAVEPAPDWAWVVQADGRVQHVGLRAWNAQAQDPPAPGAWLWLPLVAQRGVQKSELKHESKAEPVDALALQRFNRAWAEWLGTQGVSSAVAATAFVQHQTVLQAPAPDALTDGLGGALTPGQYVRPAFNTTASNWGNVGVLQTPTARMHEAGYFGVGVHRTWPYAHTSVMLQPFSWMETGFRYTDISNRLYGPESLSGSQSYKDKSIDLKLQLSPESAQRPALALGWRDMGGTGLFSAEYLVASKRSGAWDASLGMAWGYMGSRANVGNPLSRVLGPNWDVRHNDAGQGGTFATRSWFHGPAAVFAGLQYQSPWGVVLKAELDPNHYQAEPLGNVLPSKTPLNWGVVYQPWRGVAMSAGIERGNTWSFGMTFFTDLSGLSMPKVTDPPLQARRSPWSEDWAATAHDLQTHTQWQVDQMYLTPNTLVVAASDSTQPYPQRRLDQAMAVLHRAAPPEVQEVEVQHHGVGGVLAVQRVNRSAWATAQSEPARTQTDAYLANPVVNPASKNTSAAPTETSPTTSTQPTYTPQATDAATALLPARRSTSYVEPGLDLIHTLGGPDAFVLYQFSAALKMGLKLPGDLEVKALARMRLLNNYNKFTYDAPSRLPRVRTYLREYFQASPTSLSNLSLSQTGRATRDVYWAAYGGYFEEMFGGVGAEVLYRQPGSRWALGADVNQVRQRGFEQRLAFQDYRVRTGHVTGYWMTPFEGVQASLAAGQYLAGDKGATLTLTRVFANGATMGAYATKTNVPAAVFGEGSFDKGIFWSVPFDALLTSTARGTAHFMWKPLTRDGGAMVGRPVNLFQDTTWLDPNVHRYAPAAPPNDAVIPDDRIEPFVRGR